MRSPKLLKTREKVLKVLSKLAAELGSDVYLFGSYARGDHLVDSDVDIVVVSKLFEAMKYVDRVAFVREKLPKDMGFDIIALTPSELAINNAFIRDVSKDWIKLGEKKDVG